MIFWKTCYNRDDMGKERKNMIYRDFQDLKLSALGMGAMRLPVVNGDDGNVDEKRQRKWSITPWRMG